MPWTPAQMKAIRARKHGWNPPGKQPFENVSHEKLGEMEHEGIRPSKKKKKRRASLKAQMKGMS